MDGDIKKILNEKDAKAIFEYRKKEIENQLNTLISELSKINYLMEGINVRNEIIIKTIPSYKIFYRDGIISDLSKITEFVLETGSICAKANPTLKCVTPEYCYISYLDNEYKEKDIKIRYAQAIETMG